MLQHCSMKLLFYCRFVEEDEEYENVGDRYICSLSSQFTQVLEHEERKYFFALPLISLYTVLLQLHASLLMSIRYHCVIFRLPFQL